MHSQGEQAAGKHESMCVACTLGFGDESTSLSDLTLRSFLALFPDRLVGTLITSMSLAEQQDNPGFSVGSEAVNSLLQR